jgi:hypothetical protein
MAEAAIDHAGGNDETLRLGMKLFDRTPDLGHGYGITRTNNHRGIWVPKVSGDVPSRPAFHGRDMAWARDGLQAFDLRSR